MVVSLLSTLKTKFFTLTNIYGGNEDVPQFFKQIIATISSPTTGKGSPGSKDRVD